MTILENCLSLPGQDPEWVDFVWHELAQNTVEQYLTERMNRFLLKNRAVRHLLMIVSALEDVIGIKEGCALPEGQVSAMVDANDILFSLKRSIFSRSMRRLASNEANRPLSEKSIEKTQIFSNIWHDCCASTAPQASGLASRGLWALL